LCSCKTGVPILLLIPVGFSRLINSSQFQISKSAEGVLEKTSHADLHSFFEVIGGSLEQDELIVPTDQGLLQLKDGNLCNGKPGKLQIFLYKITNPSPAQRTGFLYEQIKLSPEEYSNYVMSPYANAPPGDCIIIELAPEKTKTEFMCESYTVALKNGDLKKA